MIKYPKKLIARHDSTSSDTGEARVEDGQVTWCHCIKNTRDHAEVPELRKQLELDD